MKHNDQYSLPKCGHDAEWGGSATLPSLEMDADAYLPDLEKLDLSEGEKIALLQTLWDIMKAFVEMGFDVGHADICGRIFDGVDQDENNIADDVKSSFARATETNGHDRRKERPA